MQIAIDQDRQILYTRSQAGVIVVCHSPGPCYMHQHNQQPSCILGDTHTPLFGCSGFAVTVAKPCGCTPAPCLQLDISIEFAEALDVVTLALVSCKRVIKVT